MARRAFCEAHLLPHRQVCWLLEVLLTLFVIRPPGIHIRIHIQQPDRLRSRPPIHITALLGDCLGFFRILVHQDAHPVNAMLRLRIQMIHDFRDHLFFFHIFLHSEAYFAEEREQNLKFCSVIN